MSYLIIGVVIYFIIGLSITAFCVHMSYHEAAVGCQDSDDTRAQKVLESRIGPLGFVFLFTFWPLALLIAFAGQKKIVAHEHGTPVTGAPPQEGSSPAPAQAGPH